MKPPEANASSVSDTLLTGGPRGRSIFSDAQWCVLAESLQLSGRELGILQSIFDDRTEAEAARELGISRHTVHTHLERLYRKLGVASRCGAVVEVFTEYLRLESPEADGRRAVS